MTIWRMIAGAERVLDLLQCGIKSDSMRLEDLNDGLLRLKHHAEEDVLGPDGGVI